MDKNKIHVCHLVYSFDVGGLERVIANCINALDDILFQHTIIALTSVGDFICEIDKPVRHYSLQKKDGNDLFLHFRLYRLFRKLKPDVLHTYNLATIEYQWVGLLARVPLRIHAEHGRDTYDPEGSVNKYQLVRRICSYAIHRIVAVSQDLKNWLSVDVKIPSRKLTLISNGIDTDFYHPDYVVNTENDSLKGKFVFGHVSRLHGIKNQKMLLEGFALACQQSSEFSESCILVLVGDGPDRKRLEHFVDINELLTQKVLFAGTQSNVRDYYQLFDVFVMSSIAEGIPMTLLESMAMAVPHLVTPVGGINEVVCEGETGFTVASNDVEGFSRALMKLHEDKEKRKSMAKSARERVVSHFSQTAMTSAYAVYYKRAKL